MTIHRGLQVSHFAKLRFSSLLFLFSSNISVNINISKPNYNYHASHQTLAQLFPLSLVRGVSVSIVIPVAELNDPFFKREHFKPILVITRQSLAFVTVNKSFHFEVWETRKIFFFFWGVTLVSTLSEISRFLCMCDYFNFSVINRAEILLWSG